MMNSEASPHEFANEDSPDGEFGETAQGKPGR
jgi:hypothetical protein